MENNIPERNFRLGPIRVRIWRDIHKEAEGTGQDRSNNTTAPFISTGRWGINPKWNMNNGFYRQFPRSRVSVKSG